MKRFFAMLLALVPTTSIAEELVANAELCAPYRRGPVVSEPIAVYDSVDDLKADNPQFLTVWFRPEYSWDSFWSPSPENGLPGRDFVNGDFKRDLMFDISISDGQPQPLQYRRSVSPLEKTHFRLLLLGAFQTLPLERIIRNAVNAPDDADWLRTGEIFHGFERVEIPEGDPNWQRDRDVFVEIDSSGTLTAVMECSVADEFAINPICEIFENTPYWLSKTGGIRRNDQLGEIATIRQHARAFTACLTWMGD